MRTFLEGVDAVRLPCTLAVLVPGVITVVTAGGRSAVAWVGFLVGTTAIAWARFTDNWFGRPGLLALVALGGLVIAAITTIWWFRDRRPELVAPGAVALGGVTAWLWQPCVGPRLGDILNDAPDQPFAELAPLAAYLAGATLIALAIVIAPRAIPALERVRDDRRVPTTGLVLGLGIGATIAAGVYDDLVAELLRHSSI